MAEEVNPYAQFVTPDILAPAGHEEPNPYAQFVEPDAAEERGAAAPPFRSRVIGTTEFGMPIFENEEDNRALNTAHTNAFKGMLLGFAKGLHDIPMSVLQMGTRGAEALLPEGSKAKSYVTGEREALERSIGQTEKDYRESIPPEASGVSEAARIGGNAAMTAPLAAVIPGAGAAGLIPRMAAGGTGGAVTGALSQPVEVGPDESFLEEKGKQALAGAAGGAVAPVIGGAVARVISPNVRPEVKALMDAGVRPTPGQIAGGAWNRIEEAAQSIPFVGDAIKGARGRAVEDLNRAAINRSLQPIGEELGAGTPLGREAIGEMHEKIGGNYDRLVPHLSVQIDPQFYSNLTNLASGIPHMPQETGRQFAGVIQDLLNNKFSPGGGMTGHTFKEVESELGRMSSDYTHSSVASERQLGGAFKQLQLEMRQLLVRSNPDKASELAAANNAFANALRVEGAAAKSGTEQGVFTPAHLLQSVRQLDPTLRKGAYARGDALMQELADAGKTVLGNKVPDSGTPLRSAVAGGAILGPLYAWNPAAAASVAGAGAGAMGLYSRPGVSALAKLLASRGPLAGPTAAAIRYPGNVSLPAILAAQQVNAENRPQ